MSCEIVTPAGTGLEPNGCMVRNAEFPKGCLTEINAQRQTLAAGDEVVLQFSTTTSGLTAVDLVLENIHAADPADIAATFPGDLEVTAVSVNGTQVWPKVISNGGALNLGDRSASAAAFTREAVYWYGFGPLGTGTPLSAVLRASGAVSENSSINVELRNAGATDIVFNASLVCALIPGAPVS